MKSYEYLATKKYEYFDGHTWIETAPGNSTENVYRTTEFIDNEYGGSTTTIYYLEKKIHRLDGPAYSQLEINTQIEHTAWIVHNCHLYFFSNYFSEENIAENVFKYAINYPKHIAEIELLARHNKWLTEEEILLLKTINLFV